MFQILIAEDNNNTRRLISAILTQNGYHTLLAANGQEALNLFENNHVDLAIIDVMMPVMDGYELTKILREYDNMLPIIILSAKQLPIDKKMGFIAGTDDYMTKPFEEEELLLRIKALLRRTKSVNERKMTLGKVVLDCDSLTVRRDNETQTLPQKEFFLLFKLLSNPNVIFTRIQLMDEIWGINSESSDSTINVHINRLRRRFENYPEFDIVSVRGLGYKAVLQQQ